MGGSPSGDGYGDVIGVEKRVAVAEDSGDSWTSDGGSTLKVGASDDNGAVNIDLNAGRSWSVKGEAVTVSLFDLFMMTRLSGVEGSRRVKEDKELGSDISVKIPLKAEAQPAESS